MPGPRFMLTVNAFAADRTGIGHRVHAAMRLSRQPRTGVKAAGAPAVTITIGADIQ